MSVNPNPPIQLDPSMDTGHQLAFINQNFQNLSDLIQKSVLPLKSDSVSFTVVADGSSQGIIVTHNLNIVPQVLAQAVTPFQPQAVPLPISINPGSATGFISAYVLAVDPTTVTFNVGVGSGAGGYAGKWTITYLLLNPPQA